MLDALVNLKNNFELQPKFYCIKLYNYIPKQIPIFIPRTLYHITVLILFSNKIQIFILINENL